MRAKQIVIAICLCISGAVAVHSQSGTPPAPPTKAPDADTAKAAAVQRVVRKSNELVPIKRSPPQYPMAARQQHIEGTVLLRAVIGTDGHVIETKYISGPSEFVRPSIDALKQWRFKPTLVDGNAVEVESVFEFNFRLGG
nr:energy transducer TonB [Candidatus Acidoferrales bacterium]